jgi:hypothetical protein
MPFCFQDREQSGKLAAEINSRGTVRIRADGKAAGQRGDQAGDAVLLPHPAALEVRQLQLTEQGVPQDVLERGLDDFEHGRAFRYLQRQGP